MSSIASSEDENNVPQEHVAPKKTHPKASEMVNCALDELKDRHGSSVQAIKKFIGAKYDIDPERQTFYIKKYLKTAVARGSIIQTSGKGASGSFKLQKSGSRTNGKPLAVVNPSTKESAKETAIAIDAGRILTSTPHPKMIAKRKKRYPTIVKVTNQDNEVDGIEKGTNSKTTDRVTKPKTDNVTKPKINKAAEPKTDKVTKPKINKTTESKTGKPTEPRTRKASEPKTGKATEPKTVKATEPKTGKASEPKTSKATEPKTAKEKEPKPKAAPKDKPGAKNKVSKQASEEKIPKVSSKAPKEKETESKATKRPSKKQSKAVKDDTADAMS